MNCTICNKELTGRQTKYCSNKCKHQDINHKHNNYTAQQVRGKARKIDLIKSRGGGCERCGYNKNYSAIDFHHKDSDLKVMKLDLRHLSNMSMARIMEEFYKCEVLCANCHRETHNPECLIR